MKTAADGPRILTNADWLAQACGQEYPIIFTAIFNWACNTKKIDVSSAVHLLQMFRIYHPKPL